MTPFQPPEIAAAADAARSPAVFLDEIHLTLTSAAGAVNILRGIDLSPIVAWLLIQLLMRLVVGN